MVGRTVFRCLMLTLWLLKTCLFCLSWSWVSRPPAGFEKGRTVRNGLKDPRKKSEPFEMD